jgi:hypothetical protein
MSVMTRRRAALGHGDQALDDRPHFLRLRHGRHDVLVMEQVGRQPAQQRAAFLRVPAQAPVPISMSHVP